MKRTAEFYRTSEGMTEIAVDTDFDDMITNLTKTANNLEKQQAQKR